MDKLFWVALCMITGIPTIAVLDYMLFAKQARCSRCGLMPGRFDWAMACVLESFLFIAGMLLGVFIK